MSYSLLVCLFRYCYRYTKKTKTTATSLSASQAGGDDDIYSHQTLSLGSKYIKKCVSFLVYLEPKKRVWWLQMSWYFCQTKSNRKLSYRRESAHLRSLRLSRSFKVIDFDTKRKSVCDFLLVNNMNLRPISHLFELALSRRQIIFFHQGCLLLMHSFSASSANIAVCHMLLKLYSLEYILVADTMGLSSINWPPKLLNSVGYTNAK